MTTKHTPGPWAIGYVRSYRNNGVFDGGAVDRYGNANAIIINGPKWRLAQIDEAEEWRSQDEVDANARLIASAPSLLNVLERMTEKVSRVNAIQHSGGAIEAEDWAELYQMANEAQAEIAKARGE
jgi:hypothetical protein